MNGIPELIKKILFLFSLIYAFFFLGFEREVKDVMIVFYILTFFTLLLYRKDLFKSFLAFLLVFGALITVISWFFMTKDHPEIANSSPNTEPLLDKLIFIPLALALAGNRKRTIIFLSLAMMSTILLPWARGDGWAEFVKLSNGQRVSFGGNNIATMGMNYALMLVGALVMLVELVKKRGGNAPCLIAASLIIMCMGAVGVVGSGTRSVYLGLFVLFGCMIGIFIHKIVIKKEKNKLMPVAFLAVAGFLSTLMAYQHGYFENVIERTEREISVVDQVLSGGVEKVSRNSAGLRIHFWDAAVSKIMERPFVGWDYGANKRLHIEEGNYFKSDVYFITMHNDYLDLLLAYGVLGLLFLFLLVFWTLSQARRKCMSGDMSGGLYFYYKCFILFFFTNSFFVSALFLSDTRFSWNIIMAIVVGFILAEGKDSGKAAARG